MPLALFAASQGERHDGEVILREVIAAGGDTDTNASLTGQILGASIGYSGLPRLLAEDLRLATDLVKSVERFATFCSG